jgi:hypothetical protein
VRTKIVPAAGERVDERRSALAISSWGRFDSEVPETIRMALLTNNANVKLGP